jgi:hypothetical protein
LHEAAPMRSNLLQQCGESVKVAHLVQKVASAELSRRATVFAQIVIRENDRYDVAVLAAAERAQYPETGTVTQMNIKQNHIHWQTLQCRDGL